MEHNLFLVHGMGVHDNDTWADKVINKLQETAQRYEYFEGREIKDHVNFIPISYDEKLARLLTLWKENSVDMVSFLNDQELDPAFSISDILNFFENADEEEKNFFWSHIADVLIYRFFLTFQSSIRAHVALQFVEGINWIKENNPGHQSRSVMTHSLGNIVAHDALHMLGTNQFDEFEAFTPEDGRFQALFALANLCRLMRTDFDPYNSIIRPLSAGGDALYHLFVNVTHKLDPLTIPWCFSPDDWGEEYLDITINHYHDWNIHGFDHFLDNPKVHIPLLRTIIDPSCISRAEINEAYDRYENSNQFGGKLKCIDEIKTIVNCELKPLVEGISEENAIQDLIPVFLKSYNICKKIKETAEGCDETELL